MRWASLRSAPPYKGGPSIPQRRLVEARRLGGERAPVETGLRDGVLEPRLVHMRQDQLGERAAQQAPVVAAPSRPITGISSRSKLPCPASCRIVSITAATIASPRCTPPGVATFGA